MMACFLALATLNASAGNVTFNISLTGSILTLTQQGDSSGFYPVVLRMLPDGQWKPLDLAPGEVAPAEMGVGAQLDFVWPEARPLTSLPPFERIQPMMVRFFDQAGVGLGQISFFNQPPTASQTLKAGYASGQLVIEPPPSSSIRSSWLLWPQEDGIEPIRYPVQFDQHRQPPARHIEWRSGMGELSVNTGDGQPVAMLLHETEQGYTVQTISSGGVQGKQQRSAWLDAGRWFYGVGGLAAAAAAILIALHFVGRRRGVEA